MPGVHRPAPSSRDRAERHVFGALPELPAVERRVLALLELCSASVDEAAADLGIDEQAVRGAAFAGRRALRRSRAPLAAGGRCERAERLVSDRLDGALERLDRRWLEIHLARCPRCEEHERLLDEARAELRASLAAAPPPAAPERPAAEPPRAQLRVVPPSPAAPEPPAAAPEPPPPPAEPPPAAIEWPVEPRSAVEVSTRRAAAAARVARVVALILLVAALLAAAGYGLAQLGGGGESAAPWAQPHAPNVHPAPLSGQ